MRPPAPARAPAPDRCRSARARSRRAARSSRLAPARARRSAAPGRTPRARRPAQGPRARRTRGSRAGGDVAATPRGRGPPPAPRRDGSSSPSTAPASTSWKISHRPPSSVRRMRWSASVSTTGRISASGAPANSARSDGLVRDLRPRRRDEVVEEARGDLALRRASARRSPARGDRRRSDRRHRARRASPPAASSIPRRARRPRGAASRAGGTAPRSRAASRSARPRRGRPGRARSGPRRRRPARARRARPRRRPPRPRAPSTARAAGGSPRVPRLGRAGRAAARCANRFGIASLEPIESRERVLAEREEHVHAQRPVHELGERALEAARVAVVREVLLGLVEDHVDVALGLGTLGDVEQLAAVDAGGRGERRGEPVLGIVAPAREDDDDRLLRQVAQLARDAPRGGATTCRRRSARRAR